ncbi:DUF5683 domain-containing protein [Lishizhenia sp.]|uniref:DUF5683 domain-containing protein n=1 Tax=Lishizhenia sp. TaxID=2497594 RepID=UPI00299EE4C6|nr:DUF5683 domain-containing protein [Lishizhenia sp.]MDX1446935.1 DUF5683 domain-containing protein [Lishizhenia sp.]
MRTPLLILFILIGSLAWCQNNDTIAEPLPLKDTIHSPSKAMKFSAIVPGAGQFYNHFAKPKGKRYAFIKVPIIYAGLGLAAYSIYTNSLEVDRTRLEYYHRLDNPGSFKFPEYIPLDQGALITEYNFAKRNRDLSIAAFVIVWGLNVLDAGVEAHFVNFDVSPDLSLNLRPTLLNNSSYGLSLAFNFR